MEATFHSKNVELDLLLWVLEVTIILLKITPAALNSWYNAVIPYLFIKRYMLYFKALLLAKT